MCLPSARQVDRGEVSRERDQSTPWSLQPAISGSQQEHPLESPKPGSIHRSQSREAAEIPSPESPSKQGIGTEVPCRWGNHQNSTEMQENRTPAPQSGEPRNQKPAAESPNPRKRSVTRQSGPAERMGHTAQPTPPVQNPWGPARSHTGRGRAHSTPRPPVSHSQVTLSNPGPWNPLNTHTHTQGGQRHVRLAGRRCSAFDCHTAHSAVRRSRVHTAMGNGSTPRAVLCPYPRNPGQHVTESSRPIIQGVTGHLTW